MLPLAILGPFVFVALVVAFLAGAESSAARAALRTLAESHAALQARVAAMAPAQLDALDAAVSARLVALEAPTDTAVIAALQAAKAAPVPPDAAPAAVLPAPAATATLEPADPTLERAEAILAQHGFGPWREDAPCRGKRWLVRENKQPGTPGRGIARVGLLENPSWRAEVARRDSCILDVETRSGYVDKGDGAGACRAATIALAALLLKYAP